MNKFLSKVISRTHCTLRYAANNLHFMKKITCEPYGFSLFKANLWRLPRGEPRRTAQDADLRNEVSILSSDLIEVSKVAQVLKSRIEGCELSYQYVLFTGNSGNLLN
jgi:hypothetical protein